MLDQRGVAVHGDLQLAALGDFLGELARVPGVEGAVGVRRRHVPLGLRERTARRHRERDGNSQLVHRSPSEKRNHNTAMNASVRVASDVGGTFTDSIAYDESTRAITVSKVSTTPENRALATIAGLGRALALQGKSGSDVKYVGHGMTTATNAVIQRKGARTAFITNAGFRDLLLIGRQERPSLYDIRVTRPAPLVAREHCFTVRGRMDAGGREIEPLSTEDLERAARAMESAGVESVAICFLHSYANPAHERQARDFFQRHLPGTAICASIDILAEFREYERASTAVLNAFL